MSRESAMAIATGKGSAVPASLGGTSDASLVLQGSNDQKQSKEPTEETPSSTTQTPPDDLVSTRIAQIAKKEARYREEQEEFKKKIAEFQDAKGRFDPFYAKYKEFEEMRGKDPVAAIKMLGFTDTDYVNFVAAQEDKSTPEERAGKIADAKIAQFRAEQEEKAQKEEQQRNEEAVSGFRKNIGITLKANAERFELCNYYGEAAEALIMKTVQEAYQEDLKTNPDAEPLSAERASELVESYYEDFHKEANKLKKFQPKEEIEEEPVAKKEVAREEPLKAEVKPGMPARTLTNKVAPAATGSAKKESPSDKRERLKRWLATGVKQ